MEKEFSFVIEWRDIHNYEGLYQVSNNGLVRSVDHIVLSYNGKSSYYRHCKGKILKPAIDNSCGGYRVVSLCKNGKWKNFHIHRLVAEAFIQNPNNFPEIDHIIPVRNGGTDDVSNLRWVTKKMNANNGLSLINRSIAQILVSDKKHISMLGKCTRKLLQYDKEHNLVKVYDNIIHTCEELGFNYKTITSAIHKNKKAYGYYWESSKH